MRFAEQASRSIKFAIFWAADYIIRLLLDLEGYLRKLALCVTWPSFGIIIALSKAARMLTYTILRGLCDADFAGSKTARRTQLLL
jgi:hypothetical protein